MFKVILFSILTQIFVLPFAHAAWLERSLANLDVSEGRADVRQLASGLIDVRGPRFRATEQNRNFTSGVLLEFGYRGEAAGGTPLESGEYRVQIGQKLLSANPCNLVYVMWRLYPVESVVVSVKRHAGTTSAECGNQGYTTISSTAVPATLTARTGLKRALQSTYQPHTKILTVKIDDTIIWRGRLPANLVNDLIGPPGVRTDNGLFRLRFYTNTNR